jgi:hypothetical protein
VRIGGRVGHWGTPEGGARNRSTGKVGETPAQPRADGTDRPAGRRKRQTDRSETDQPPSATARDGRGGNRALGPRGWTKSTRVVSAFQGSRWGFLRLHGRASRSQVRSSRSHDLLCLGFTAGSRGAPGRNLGTPPSLHRRSGAAAEAARVARSSTAKGKPSLVFERSRSARRPGSRAISTKVAPFQGRRDPACRRPCTGVW